jgi:hypothetical protein
MKSEVFTNVRLRMSRRDHGFWPILPFKTPLQNQLEKQSGFETLNVLSTFPLAVQF